MSFEKTPTRSMSLTEIRMHNISKSPEACAVLAEKLELQGDPEELADFVQHCLVCTAKELFARRREREASAAREAANKLTTGRQ